MNNMNTGGPAFPAPAGVQHITEQGMTLRQYAAIKLKVPDSGTDWLDDMIKKSVRDDFAATALHEVVEVCPPGIASQRAYEFADAMMKAREK